MTRREQAGGDGGVASWVLTSGRGSPARDTGAAASPDVRLPEAVSCRSGDGDGGKRGPCPPCPQRALVSGTACAVTSAHAGACFAASVSFFVLLGEA